MRKALPKSEPASAADAPPASERLKLLIAYDGRRFSGWQSQADRNGVQDHLEAALEKITGGAVRVHGSGRTDAGVHALGQVAHADVPKGLHGPPRWLAALNANLPYEVRVLKVTRVRGDRAGAYGFHARYDATGKRYTYRIWNEAWLHPLEIGRAWLAPWPIDLTRLRDAAALLVGRHDFAAFAATRRPPETDTVRTIHRIAAQRRGPLITLHFEGDGFLYKMVRILTGTLVRQGQGKAELAEFRRYLAGQAKAQFAAPAEGLYLAKVFYGKKAPRPEAARKDEERDFSA